MSGDATLNYVMVGDTEVITERAFTHPDRSRDDIGVLRHIAGRVREVLRQPEERPGDPYPRVVRFTESDGCALRIVICNRGKLLEANDVSVVGFFGQRRPTSDCGPQMDTLDEELIEEFLQHPGILAYCSLELEPGGNWANLVLMSHADAKAHWVQSERHAYASQVLAPKHYNTVRLHNGDLPGGLMAGGDVLLVRTKYYDYQQDPKWRAIREMSPAQRYDFL